MKTPLTLLSAIIGLTSVVQSQTQPRDTQACNNSPSLCDLSYSSITHLGAHDSPFLRDSSTSFSTAGNQYYNSTVQLSAGVRLLTAQVHNSNGAWHLCHTSCDLLDAGTLEAWLATIKTWMDSNPNEVVTILLVNSDDATPADLAPEFSQSGITTYAYTPPSTSTPPATWPALSTLIAANTRLLTFVASLDTSLVDSSTSYLMDEFTFIFENPFQNDDLANFTCLPNRPSSVENSISAAIDSNRMALMNHFLDMSELFGIEVPDVSNITTTNSNSTVITGALGESLNACKTAYGKAPQFVLVDFFDQGPAISAVDNINGVTDAVGRSALPSQNTSESYSESSFSSVETLVAMVKEGETPSLGAWIWAGGDWKFGGLNLNGGSLTD